MNFGVLLLFNIIINSFLAFFTAVFFIEASIWLFRVKEPKITKFLRCFPMFKLPFDLFMYNWESWTAVQGIDLFSLEEGSRNLSFGFQWNNSFWDHFSLPASFYIRFWTSGGNTFSIADLIYPLMSSVLIYFLFLFLVFSCLKTIFRMCRGIQTWISLYRLYEDLEPLLRPVCNQALAKELSRYSISLMTGDQIGASPFAAAWPKPVIVFPREIEQILEQKEFEAAVAHEIGHIKQHDQFFRVLVSLISNIFWWVPTKGLVHRIYRDQEIAADKFCSNFKIDPLDLASAIYQCAFLQKFSKIPGTALIGSRSIHERISKLLEKKITEARFLKILSSILAVGMSVMILGSKFWIF